MRIIKSPIFIVVVFYLLSLVVVWPVGNYAVGDDFFYLTQIKAFNEGYFTKSALIGPAFILQGFMGLIWSHVFGLNYFTLRILTILVSLLSLFFLDLILKNIGFNKEYRLITLLLVTFNIYFYANSLNFMTENYFILFLFISLHFFIKFMDSAGSCDLIASGSFAGLSIMVRQFGVILLPVYLVIYFIKTGSKSKLNLNILLLVAPLITIGACGLLWPKYVSSVEPKSLGLAMFVASSSQLLDKFLHMQLLPYVGYFLTPLVMFIVPRIQKTVLVVVVGASSLTSYFIYKVNIFTIGNLFYLEGYQARLRVNIRENLFNNITFKYVTAFSIAFTLTVSVCLMILIIGKLKLRILKDDLKLVLLISLTLGFFLLPIVAEAFFDRYFMNFFIFLIITIIYLFHKYKVPPNKLVYLFLLLNCFTTILMLTDYHRENRLKWFLSYKLVSEFKIAPYDIFIDSIYASSVYMDESKNFKGAQSQKPKNYDPWCFVQEFSKKQGNLLYSFISWVHGRWYVRRYFGNPEILYAQESKARTNHFDKTDRLLYEAEYFSPVYNLLGIRMYVRAFCTVPN